MDAQAKKAFRAKLSAQKKDKRIDSPLVSRALLEQAITNMKATAAGQTRVDAAKAKPPRDLPKPKQTIESHNSKIDSSTNVAKTSSSSGLPANFFDNQGTKGQNSGTNAVKIKDADQHKNQYESDDDLDGPFATIRKNEAQSVQNSNRAVVSENKPKKGALPEGFFDSKESNIPDPSSKITSSETNQQKGALPEGFFDNKDADLRARGIKPVKVDVNDEYKEFEKLIQEDLKDVDDRLEEEEIDAADMVVEAETWEQKAYRERVEMLKRKKLEMAAKSNKRSRTAKVESKESDEEESSSDDDDTDKNVAVDWRAQHL
ncbi:hypothetical protein ACFE04_005261 [Oxalis oulophora]